MTDEIPRLTLLGICFHIDLNSKLSFLFLSWVNINLQRYLILLKSAFNIPMGELSKKVTLALRGSLNEHQWTSPDSFCLTPSSRMEAYEDFVHLCDSACCSLSAMATRSLAKQWGLLDRGTRPVEHGSPSFQAKFHSTP